MDPRAAIEIAAADVSTPFRTALTRENHTLKRALTDPRSSAPSATPIPTRSSTREDLPDQADVRVRRSEIVACTKASDRLETWTERLGQRRRRDFRTRDGVFGKAFRARPLPQPCPTAASRCSASCTRETSATTAAAARRAVGCSPTRALSRLLHKDWPRNRRGSSRERYDERISICLPLTPFRP
jgi:formamidopyrimidine-DNA glycosylase